MGFGQGTYYMTKSEANGLYKECIMFLITFYKIYFVLAIADNDIEDVRVVLKHYSKYDDPVEAFRIKQKQYIEEMDAQAAAKREQESSKLSKWTPSFLKRSY